MTEEQIAEAASLLDSDRSALEAHIRTRLAEVHGAVGSSREWLAQQPLVERSQLKPAMHAAKRNHRRTRIEGRQTSGSTGTPFSFVKDSVMISWMDAAMWAVYAWHGIRPGDAQVRFWGVKRDIGGALRQRTTDAILGRRRLSAFACDQAESVRFFDRLRSFRPAYGYGYPTLMRAFVDHCTATGRDGKELGLRAVVCTGELLSPQTRQGLQAFFGCRVVNEYGCTESGVLVFECEYRSLHEVPVAATTEVVDDVGQELPAGHVGEIVVTDLFGGVVPLLRYRLHDRGAVLETQGCRCGRELRQIRVDDGRTDSFIVTPERGPVYDAILAYTVPPGVLRFRVYQRARDHLEAHIMPGNGFDPQRTPLVCQQNWEKALGPGLRVSMLVVDNIPYAASGKLRYFVPLS